MEPPDFPPNSEASKRHIPEDRHQVDKIVSGKVRRKRKSLRKQWGELFILGDPKSAINYAIFDIFLPAAKDTTLDVIMGGLETLFNGSGGRRRRGSAPPYQQYSPLGRVSYQQQPQQVPYNRMSGPQRALSRESRARHNFDEIVLEERNEAQAVIDQLFDLVSQYEQASVADLYYLVGLPATHTDHKWGWTTMHGAGVSRTRNGFLLDLPDPEPLD